ncbi:angiopoietin-related protein 6 [Stegostoma tigrinum]|uniref:angiopoietin-related protein 6 n=1 Tax=Stegostoma tigrinum TaxID=3053191 RepID=UPI00202B50F7|nr:angiopoietin-related protein 6 [Stegostoma tigrinum]
MMLKFITSLLVLASFAAAEAASPKPSTSPHAKRGGPSQRAKPSPEGPGTSGCTYTFIVPQQHLTGPICLNTRSPVSHNSINQSELQVMHQEMREQQQQIEDLRQMVEVDGSVLNEVKILRKENHNMNSRVSQLYTQLLHEIIQKKDNSLEFSQLENKVLNVTAQVLRLSSKYKELERKYTALSLILNNQSHTLSELEQLCTVHCLGHQQQLKQAPGEPPLVAVIPNSLNSSNNRSKSLVSGNEILKDQVYSMAQDRLKRTEQPPPTTIPMVTTKTAGPWKDCLQALEDGHQSNGIYLIKPTTISRLMQVWCEHEEGPGGWTVIQRRQDGSVNFFRSWESYKQGFGNIDGEYWLGLENIYWLTNQDNYKLRILMDDWQGRRVFAEYDDFRVEAEGDFYRLRLGHYHGNAGDSFSWHNGKQFTTLDRDRDLYSGNCAHYQKGGWWYYTCAHSNLNGVWYKGGHYRSKYQDGVYWAEFRGGAYSLKRVVMMICPNQILL